MGKSFFCLLIQINPSKTSKVVLNNGEVLNHFTKTKSTTESTSKIFSLYFFFGGKDLTLLHCLSSCQCPHPSATWSYFKLSPYVATFKSVPKQVPFRLITPLTTISTLLATYNKGDSQQWGATMKMYGYYEGTVTEKARTRRLPK